MPQKYTSPREVTSHSQNERVSMHVGSVEEFLGNKKLFEQGQVQIDDHPLFCNTYFRRFKLDHIKTGMTLSHI